MPKKTSPPLTIGPLRIVVGEVVTDPAKIAAVERMRKRLRSKKRKKGPDSISPLRIIKAEIVTDPAEIAAVERRRNRLRQDRRRRTR